MIYSNHLFSPYTIKNSVFGSDVDRAMLVTAYVENSLDYWIGIVFWRQGLSGGEGAVFNQIGSYGLSITYINQYGNINNNENCILRARAV